jgi:hypothetical protein
VAQSLPARERGAAGRNLPETELRLGLPRIFARKSRERRDRLNSSTKTRRWPHARTRLAHREALDLLAHDSEGARRQLVAVFGTSCTRIAKRCPHVATRSAGVRLKVKRSPCNP